MLRKPALLTIFVTALLIVTVSMGGCDGVPTKAEELARRGKRQVPDFEDDDIDNNVYGNCRYLPPKPQISNEDTSPTPLIQILNEGSYQMADYGNFEESVLIMGNSGSGKRTLTKFLTWDINRLYVVKTQKERPVIVDDNVLFANGTAGTSAPLLVPEMSIVQMGNELEDEGSAANNPVFFNCPSFVKTNGPDHDIAVNFFMRELLRNGTRVKMLFLLDYSSPYDFDDLVGNATQLLKDVPSYSKSIGLVVVKVDSPRSGGEVMAEIVQFLKNYLDNLRSQLNSESTESLKEVVMRKIQFMEPLVSQDLQKRYSHVFFIRGPTGCGRLGASKLMERTKERLINFYSNDLEYSLVNPDDFGFPVEVTDGARFSLRNVAMGANQGIGGDISAVMENFAEVYLENISRIKDLNQTLEELRRATGVLEEALQYLHEFDGNKNPDDVMDYLTPALGQLGYNISNQFQESIFLAQKYLEFDDYVNYPGIERLIRYWLFPVVKTLQTLKSEEEKADLKLQLEEKEWDVKRLQIEVNGLRGDFKGWRDNEMELLNNVTELLKSLNEA